MEVLCWNICVYMTLLLVQVFILSDASEVIDAASPSHQSTISPNLQVSSSIVTSTPELNQSTIATTILHDPTTLANTSAAVNNTSTFSSTMVNVINASISAEADSMTSIQRSNATSISNSDKYTPTNINYISSTLIQLPTNVSIDIFTTEPVSSVAASVRSSESQIGYQTTQLESSNVSPTLRTISTENVSVSPTSIETFASSSIDNDATTSLSQHFSISSTSQQTPGSTTPTSMSDSQIHYHSSSSIAISSTLVLTEVINTNTTLLDSSTQTIYISTTSPFIDTTTATRSASSSEIVYTQLYLQNRTEESTSSLPLTETTFSVTESVDRSSPSTMSSGVSLSTTSVQTNNSVSTEYSILASSESEQSSIDQSTSGQIVTSSYELSNIFSESTTLSLESPSSSSFMSSISTRSGYSSSPYFSVNNASEKLINGGISSTLNIISTSTALNTPISSSVSSSTSPSSEVDMVSATSKLEQQSSMESVVSTRTTVMPSSSISVFSSSEGISKSSSLKSLLESIEITLSSESFISSPSTLTGNFVSSSAISELTATIDLSETTSSVYRSPRPTPVSPTPPLQTVTDHIIVSPSVTRPETTEQTDMAVSITTSLSSTISPTMSSNIPKNETEHRKGTLTRAMITFDGNCHLLKYSVAIQKEFLKAWANEVEINTGLDIDTDGMEIEEILCDPFRVILHMIVNDTALFRSVRNERVWSNFNVKIPDSLRELNFSLKRLQILDDDKDIDEFDDVSIVGHLEVTDLVIIGVASFLFLVLVTMLVIVLCRECYIRKRSSSFSLSDVPHINLKLSDFTLTKIPRPQVIYRENSKRKPDRVPVTRVDPISRNVNRQNVEGHNETLNGSSNKNRIRMPEHAYGLVVGVMGNKQVNGSPNDSMISDKSNGEDPLKNSLLTKGNDDIYVGINNPTFSANDEEVNGNTKFNLKEEEIEHFL